MSKGLIVSTFVLASLVLSACGGDGTSYTVTLKGAGASTSDSLTFSAVDPSVMMVKVYRMAVSTSGDCSNPTVVYENDSPDSENFLEGPTLGAASIPAGTYECVILEISDTMSFTPASTEGDCVEDEATDLEVCRAETDTEILSMDGDTESCDDGEQKIAVYLSTWSTSEGGGESNNPMQAPSTDGDDSHGIMLADPLVVSGNSSVAFIVNGDGKVEDTGDSCDMQPPIFAFEEL